jgi:hypothetical protein
MTVEYYLLSPVILTDNLFFQYCPALTVSGSAAQRQAAYLAAEQLTMDGIGTFLLPTTITGTFLWPPVPEPFILPHNRIHSIDRIVVTSLDGGCTCDVTEYAGCGLIRDGDGVIDARVTEGAFLRACGCGPSLRPYQAFITYTAGLPTGTAANDLNLHMALAMLARLELLEMVDPGALEGGGGDQGVQSYGTLGYSETRIKLQRTPVGSSAIANKAWLKLKHLRRKRALRF